PLPIGFPYTTLFRSRSEPLILAHYDKYYPSLSIQIAAKYLNLKPQDIEARLGEGVRLGKLSIATDPYLQMNTFFYDDTDGRPALDRKSTRLNSSHVK